MLKLSRYFMLMAFAAVILFVASCNEDEEEERVTIKLNYQRKLQP